MSKGQLWDDSALINAFDHAISTYKKMHGKEYKQVSDDVNANSEDASMDANEYSQSHMETIGGGIDASHERVQVGEMQELGSTEENEGVNSQEHAKEHSLGSNTFPSEDPSHQTQIHSTSAVIDQYNQSSIDEYNQLYKEYYEIEEQRQRILEKLQQFSSLTYTDAGEPSVWGNTNQAYQSSASQVPCGCVVVPCCSCSCPYSSASCSSLSSVEKKPEDVDIVKMAMGVAERAVSSFKDNTNGLKEENKACREKEQSNGSETDLSVVLNAWFSAGIHTGKYLAEQSIAKKQHR